MGEFPFRPVVFAPGLVPVFGVGEEAHDAGERVDDGRAAGGAGVVPAHGHVALRATVDLVVHGEVHGPACRRVVDEGFHHSRVRDLRGDVQMADGPARAVPVEPALHPDAVEEVGPFFPQREELVGVERDALGHDGGADERVAAAGARSINNIVDLDLFGQVNAESAGTKQISGTGGQLDFVMGAYLSNGGKSFICLSSSMKGKDGELKSRIVPTLTPGSICTDPRSCTHYIVTEYGMVNLKGLSTWQRAEALIGIAHPDFREQLIADAEKMHIWRRSNK